jgi:hypothetical protein
MPWIKNENLKCQSNHGNSKGYDWKMLAPLGLIRVHFIVCTENI